jgi:hypothetical protein
MTVVRVYRSGFLFSARDQAQVQASTLRPSSPTFDRGSLALLTLHLRSLRPSLAPRFDVVLTTHFMQINP